MEEYVWISKLKNSPVYKEQVHPILDRVASDYAIRVTIAGADDTSDEEFTNAVYDAIKRKVSGIMLVGCLHSNSIIEAVNQAIHSSIPVITVECDIVGIDRLAYVGANWFRMGQDMADSLANMINGPGKVLIFGTTGLMNVEAGFRGFSTRISQYPDIQLLGPEDASGNDFEKAENIVTRYLKQYPDLSGIVVLNNNGGPGAARALEKFLKVRTVKLICTDANKLQLEYLKKGIIDVVFSQKHQYSTYLAFQMLYAYNHGSINTGYKPGLINIPGNIDTGHLIITDKNIDSFQQGFDIKEALNRHHLSQQVNLFTHMLENINEIVLTADLYGNVFYANPATTLQLGYKKEALLELELNAIFKVEQNFFNCLADGNCHSLETEAIKKDNTRFPVQISISPLKVEKGVSGYVIIATDISERKKAEKLLIDTEARYRGAFESSVDGILIADIETKDFVYANPAISNLLGYTIKELENLKVSDIHPKDRLEEVLAHFEAQAKQQHIVVTDLPCLKKDGTIIYCDISASLIKKFIMGRDCLLRFFRDTNERKKVQLQFKEKQETLDSLLRAAPVGIGLISNRIFKWINFRMLELTGYSQDELVDQSSRMLYSSQEEFLRVGQAQYQEIKEKGTGTIETTWVCKNKTVKQFLLSSASIDPADPEKGIIFTASDITKNKDNEKKLKMSKDKFRLLVEMTPDLIWEVDIKGEYTYISPKVIDMLGYQVTELLGKSVFDIMPELEAKKIKTILEEIVKKQETFHQLKNIVLHKDGHEIIRETSGSPYFNEQGKLRGYRGIDRDISEKKEADNSF
ncbi:MAG: PAS domain S-box protein [Candidatus Omnitrophica bacterium]|nr:PAS domain S-box protein [Candidatus Omnitrophota bacterium]